MDDPAPRDSLGLAPWPFSLSSRVSPHFQPRKRQCRGEMTARSSTRGPIRPVKLCFHRVRACAGVGAPIRSTKHCSLDEVNAPPHSESMFLQFFTSLREAQIPVTLREYLTLMEALDHDLADQSVENFYYLSRTSLVKDERNLDKFDRVFGTVSKGLESLLDAMEKAD